MTTTQQELEAFSRFASEQLKRGGATQTIDELFDLWRSENPSDELYDENVAAVRESIEDFKAGERGTVAGQHSDELRREFGISNE